MKNKLVWITWDAASFPLVKKLLANGRLPNLKNVYQNGAGMALEVGTLNCQTPAALTALYTGKPGEHYSIGGFFTPVYQENETLLTKKNSFLESNIQYSLIWHWAAINKKTVSLAHVPFSRDIHDHAENYRFTVNGYSSRICRGEIFLASRLDLRKRGQCEIHLGGYSFQLQLFTQYNADRTGKKTSEKIQVTYDINGHKQAIEITIGEINPWQKHTVSFNNHTATAIYALYSEDQTDILIIFTGIYKLTTPTASNLDIFFEKTGAFQGECFGRFYRKGLFGKTISQGGSGYAENIFLLMLNEINAYFGRVYDYVLKEFPADFNVFYLPSIDEMAHEFTGFIDENCRLFNSHYSEKYLEIISTAYQSADKLLGKIIENIGANDSILITSDHGMDSCSHILYINEILKQEKLLSFNHDGTIDLSRTAAFFHPAENGSIFINTDNFKEGIVPTADKEKIKLQVKRLLENYIDSAGGEKIHHRVIDINKMSLENKMIYGDLFFIPAQPYSLKAGPGPQGENIIIEKTNKSGYHHFNRGSASMKGICFIKSPIMTKETNAGKISSLDIFSLICKILQVPNAFGNQKPFREKVFGFLKAFIMRNFWKCRAAGCCTLFFSSYPLSLPSYLLLL